MKTVSIIVPVYKTETYLPRCVDSILGQSYSDLEVILVDDGSPDGSPALCDRYAARDPRVRVIHKENGGVSSARNAGLRAAGGNYITFCDSDDSLEKGWISALVTAMEESNADVVAANHSKYFADGEIRATDHETGLILADAMEERLRYIIGYLLTDRHGWEVTTRLFRRDLIRDNDLRFSETCGNFAEDMGFLLRYSLYTRRIRSISESGYRYYMRQESMMAVSRGTPRLDSVNEVSQEFQTLLTGICPPKLRDRYGPVLHFLVMLNQYQVAINRENYHHIGKYLAEIRRFADWKACTEQIFSCKETLEKLFGEIPAGRILIYSRYLLDRCWLAFKIRRFLFFKRRHYRD